MIQFCISAPNIKKRFEWNQTELEIQDLYLRRLSTKVIIENTEGEDCSDKVSRLEFSTLTKLKQFPHLDIRRVHRNRYRLDRVER